MTNCWFCIGKVVGFHTLFSCFFKENYISISFCMWMCIFLCGVRNDRKACMFCIYMIQIQLTKQRPTFLKLHVWSTCHAASAFEQQARFGIRTLHGQGVFYALVILNLTYFCAVYLRGHSHEKIHMFFFLFSKEY